MSDCIFPFGCPVSPCKPSANSQRRFFVLGAYPSALHVRWTPPKPHRAIRAIAVDNEPEPFWCGGESESVLIETWKKAVGWKEEWGSVAPVGHLNGSSGTWVQKNVLDPLGANRETTWITDCLDTYRCSSKLAGRIKDTYEPFAKGAGLTSAALSTHPSEQVIVDEALEKHQRRLLAELDAAAPEAIVTLGNAAFRVLKTLAKVLDGSIIGDELSSKSAAYGRRNIVRIGERQAEWLPLAHPAAPPAYKAAHQAWMKHLKG